MHSSLAITPEGLPLGLAAIKFWTRKKFKDKNALKKKLIPLDCLLKAKKALAGLPICSITHAYSMHQSVVFMLEIGKAIFISFSAKHKISIPIF